MHQRRTCVQRRSHIDHMYNMVQITHACTFHAMVWTNERTQHVSLRSTLATATLVSNTCTHGKLSYMMARLLFWEVMYGCCQPVAYQKCRITSHHSYGSGKHERSTSNRLWNQEDLATRHADIAACTLGWHPTIFTSECQLNLTDFFNQNPR